LVNSLVTDEAKATKSPAETSDVTEPDEDTKFLVETNVVAAPEVTEPGGDFNSDGDSTPTNTRNTLPSSSQILEKTELTKPLAEPSDASSLGVTGPATPGSPTLSEPSSGNFSKDFSKALTEASGQDSSQEI